MVRPFKGQALVRPGGQVMYLDLAPGEEFHPHGFSTRKRW